ncbi:phage minor head protein [Palleronia caenipelagi]|uniref:Head morphogenesis protein n=1 Tax=Palleronia caenipelagi TaxID=2489174 RepID=A0A547PW91_9RHOB|nr:phage minor head protein [Palleronia caenipelagi]TRD18386.1 head morphogenesis protein [Palleronia caenipelagi]
MADHPDRPDRPDYSFTPGPPPEVARFFRGKGLHPSFSWQDVEPEEHAVAFTVAKMAELDLLKAAKAEVQRAIDEGLTFETFQKSWRGNDRLKEWWGKARQTDPVTGESKVVTLGSPRRLRTIYRTNLRAARAAGQWERIERTKEALPYLQYRLGPSEEHRPAHAARAGLVLPVDDPFWSAWMPPNGWGCKCWVRQITRARAEALGVSDPPQIPTSEVVNTRTGEVRDVPAGIDPGFDRNPGQMRLAHMQQLLDGKLADADEATARAALRDMASSWMVERVLKGQSGAKVSIGLLPPEIGDVVGTTARFAKITDEYGLKIGTKDTPATPELMRRISDGLAEGPLYHEAREGRAPALVQPVTDETGALFEVVWKILPGEVWLSTAHKTTRRRWQRRVKDNGRKLIRE